MTITAVDTNILIDITNGDQEFAPNAINALRRANLSGVTIISDIVYAELCTAFVTLEDCDEFLDSLSIRIEALDAISSFLASRIWLSHLKSGGKRLRILPDFLVAAHAANQADVLLTRDGGFFRRYFPKLDVIDPSES